jgi:hypothetical protein
MAIQPADKRWKVSSARTAHRFVQEKSFDGALNGIHRVLDEISDELGRQEAGKPQPPGLVAGRDALQKAAELVLKAQQHVKP